MKTIDYVGCDWPVEALADEVADCSSKGDVALLGVTLRKPQRIIGYC